MNILFVTGIFPESKRETVMGGMANAVFKSAIGMKKRGHRVRVLTVSTSEGRWQYHGLDVISVRTVWDIDNNNALDILWKILRREYYIQKKIKKLNEDEQIDIIQYTGWFGIGLFHKKSIPAVMRVSSYTKIQLANNYSIWKKTILECVEYLAARRMNFIFAPSRIMAGGLQRDLNRKVAVIETPFYKEDIKEDDIIVKNKLKSKRYILYFGRMSVDKGILVIRDILYPLLKKHNDLYFVFAGNGSMYKGIQIKDELLKSAGVYKDRLIFGGMLSQERLVPVMKEAEVIVMPSLADNFPNSCAEAMALGKIVIGTNGSSIEQFITDGVNGFLTKIGSSQDLEECIEYVLNLGDEQKVVVSKNAIERIKLLDLDKYSKKMEHIYNQVLNLVKNV
jgi:glycosyltransferase involved in cell wall biosynthesis